MPPRPFDRAATLPKSSCYCRRAKNVGGTGSDTDTSESIGAKYESDGAQLSSRNVCQVIAFCLSFPSHSCTKSFGSYSNHNSVARTQNSLLLCRDDALSPLHNPATNAAIPNFPATPRDIDQLNTQGANAVLESLGQGSDGTLPAKKQRIRITVGLTAAGKEGA